MNRKTALVTLGLAAAVATVGAAVAGPAVAAGTTTVTQHFDAQSSSSPLKSSKTSYVLTDNDVAGGKTIGRDVLYCTDSGSGASHCGVAFAQNGGLLYGQFALSDATGALNGTVTGGTGSFAHAKGTLTGHATSQQDVQVTLRYTK